MTEHKMKLILLGPQGSGKGTQAEKIAELLSIPALSMGQLLREEVAAGGELAEVIRESTEKGVLVNDQIAARILKARLEKPDTANGYILDGYPRNISQYEAFDFDQPTHVVIIGLSDEEAVRRLGGRLTCDACGKITSVTTGAQEGDACPCGQGQFMVRKDDTEESILRRLGIYKDETLPVIEEYEKIGVVRHVDGAGSIDEVFELVKQALAL
jgi:adenylate kinase